MSLQFQGTTAVIHWAKLPVTLVSKGIRRYHFKLKDPWYFNN